MWKHGMVKNKNSLFYTIVAFFVDWIQHNDFYVTSMWVKEMRANKNLIIQFIWTYDNTNNNTNFKWLWIDKVKYKILHWLQCWKYIIDEKVNIYLLIIMLRLKFHKTQYVCMFFVSHQLKDFTLQVASHIMLSIKWRLKQLMLININFFLLASNVMYSSNK